MIDHARAVADAILYEGLMLFPYRRSALKNQMPWQFGVLMPRGYADRSEPTSMRSQMVLLAHRQNHESPAVVEGALRYLQAQEPCAQREIAVYADLNDERTDIPFELEGLHGTISLNVGREGDVFVLTLEVRNETLLETADRAAALRGAFISAHVLLAARSATFASLLDPPDCAKEAVARCVNERVFPVLVGQPEPGKQSAAEILVSPIILYDFPAIAAASRGHTFDATEIDELLLLSVASLTDDEKREAEQAHPYVRDLLARAEALDAEQQASLHGEVRVGGALVHPGSRVRVHPRGRADIWDDVIAGKVGRVCAVHEDFEGKQYVGVVFDDDPASDLHEWYGRAFFYGPHEIEVCASEAAPQVR